MRLKRASAYLTNPNRPAWPQIGPRLASDTGSFKNTADAPQTRLSAAVQAGKQRWSEVTSPMQLNPATPQLKEKSSLSPMPLTKADSLSLAVAVDHKPLLKVLGDRSLEDIPNARLRNLKEKTLRYRFRMVFGVRHKAADAVSRHPTGPKTPEIRILPDDIATTSDSPTPPPPDAYQCSFLDHIRCDEPPLTSCSLAIDDQLASSVLRTLAVTWDRVKVATASDRDMVHLMSIIDSAFPNFRHELPPALREYYQFCDHLYTVDSIILYKDRIVIPPSLRQHVLSVLHSAHQGVTSMIAHAETTVFWPGITPAIIASRTNCYHCNRMAPSQPSVPPSPPVPPAYPFQCVCADFFCYKGIHYLIIVDRYSNWPIIERATEGSQGLISCLRCIFTTFGIPDECATDGGPEFTAAVTCQFLKDWGVHHRLSPVAFPHSNFRAEVAVKTFKQLITNNTSPTGSLNTDALQRAILQYRNTPDPYTKLSTAQCVFGRPIRDFIPILPGRYVPHPTWRDTLAAREEALRNRHIKAAERWTEHTRRLPPLRVGIMYVSRTRQVHIPPNGTRQALLLKSDSLISTMCE